MVSHCGVLTIWLTQRGGTVVKPGLLLGIILD